MYQVIVLYFVMFRCILFCIVILFVLWLLSYWLYFHICVFSFFRVLLFRTDAGRDNTGTERPTSARCAHRSTLTRKAWTATWKAFFWRRCPFQQATGVQSTPLRWINSALDSEVSCFIVPLYSGAEFPMGAEVSLFFVLFCFTCCFTFSLLSCWSNYKKKKLPYLFMRTTKRNFFSNRKTKNEGPCE